MNEIKILNNIKWTQEYYEDMKLFLTDDIEPDYTPSRLERFKEKAELLEVDDDDNIVYGEKVLIPEDMVDEVLTELYKDPITSVNSRDRTYQAVVEKYIGISRRRVQEFLNNQEAYQLHKAPQKYKIVKPIVTHRVNQQYQVDLIDMSKGNYPFYNERTKRILTMVDLFSKKAWAYPLKNGTMASVIAALKVHFTTNPKPTLLQSDNGPEFKTDFTEYLKSIGVKHIKSQSYKPTSQGAVEAFNKTFKRRLYHWMSIYKTKEYIDLIPKVLEGYNNTKHSTTKRTPNEVFNSSSNRTRQIVQDNIEARAAKIRSPAATPLNIGVWVRLSNYVNPSDRKRKDITKKYLTNWSLDIYQVQSVSKTGRYTLYDEAGHKVPSLFSRHDLQLIDKEKLQKVRTRRPARFDGGRLMSEVIEERVNDRREGRFVLPRRVPEFTQGEERVARKESKGNKPDRRGLPQTVQRLIGKRISVYWPRFRRFYDGKVVGYAIGRSEFVVKYDEKDNTGEDEFYEKLQGAGKVRWKFI